MPNADRIKQEIKELFERKHGETIYTSDIAYEFGLDYEYARELLVELENDGKIRSIISYE